MIPLFRVHMPACIERPLLETLFSGYVGQGKKVDEFERELADWFGNPRVLTTNNGTAAIHLALRLANVGPGDTVISTPMTCVGAMTPVLLSDGTTRDIRKIVNGRESIEVMSLNTASGKLEPKHVIGWVRLSADGVEWYRLTHKHNRGSRGPRGKRGVWITGDHKILSRRGYIRVDQLGYEDEIATAGISLNVRQQELFDGTMLGDGFIQKARKGYARFGTIHSAAQQEWVDIKQRALSGVPFTHLEREAYKQSGPAYGFQSKSGLFWLREHQRWYSSRGNKIVPDDLQLTPLALAAWYLDDGSLDASGTPVFCTEGFEPEDVWRLFWKLVDIGFHPRVYGRKHSYGIRIVAPERKRFFDMIAGYVPPSMRYKLPDGVAPYNPAFWNLGEVEPAFDTVEAEKATPPAWNDRGYVYCIEVEDNHNFIAGDMVLNNCTATNMPILSAGADIVWADIQPDTGNLDPEDLRLLVRLTPRAKAIVCVHWGGTPCDMDEIRDIAEEFNLPVIEDAAHAFGAWYKGQRIGSLSEFTCFSFQAIKHLTTVDGGALTCRFDEDCARGRLLRWYGIDRTTPRRDFRCEDDIAEWGWKFHMNDVAATIGLAQLAHVPSVLEKHHVNAAYYTAAIRNRGLKHIKPLRIDDDRVSSYWLYSILCDDRDGLIKFLDERGIQASRVHERNDVHSCFRKSLVRPLPGVDEFCRRQLAVPVGWWVNEADREYIMSAIQEYDEVLG